MDFPIYYETPITMRDDVEDEQGTDSVIMK